MATQTRLGAIGDVLCDVAQTDEPWTLDITSIILPVGDQLGGLAEAVRAMSPNDHWDTIDFTAISPREPYGLRIDQPHGSLLAVLVPPHERPVGTPTPDSIRDATISAVEMAALNGSIAIGLPLLGTGRIGLDPFRVAPVVVQAAIEELQVLHRASSRQIVFFGRTDAEISAIRYAWGQVSLATTGATSGPVSALLPSGTSLTRCGRPRPISGSRRHNCPKWCPGSANSAGNSPS